MTDISKLFLQQIGLRSGPFSMDSRYHGVEITSMENEEGNPVPYVKRRLIPPCENFHVIQKYVTTEGDRPDLLAEKFYNSPKRFWQICDANVTLDPAELINTPGNTVRLALPNNIALNNNG